MAVDLNAVEGRIVMIRGRSTEFFPWYEKGGVITRMSGKRAYYTDENGKERFTHEFSAIVDTPDEEATLLQFTKTAKQKLELLLKSLHRDAELVEATLNGGSKKMKLISPPRVRRVRA